MLSRRRWGGGILIERRASCGVGRWSRLLCELVIAGNAALPGGLRGAAEGGGVEVGAEGHAEAGEGVGRTQGDFHGVAAVGGLVHIDVDGEVAATFAGEADGGLADAYGRAEQRIGEQVAVIHGRGPLKDG